MATIKYKDFNKYYETVEKQIQEISQGRVKINLTPETWKGKAIGATLELKPISYNVTLAQLEKYNYQLSRIIGVLKGLANDYKDITIDFEAGDDIPVLEE